MVNQKSQLKYLTDKKSLNFLSAKGVLVASVSVVLGGLSLHSAYAKTAYAEKQSLAEVDRALVNCSQIETAPSRLACYDQVTLVQQTQGFNAPQQKKQIDLSRTLKTAFEGKPEIIIDDPKRLQQPKPFIPASAFAKPATATPANSKSKVTKNVASASDDTGDNKPIAEEALTANSTDIQIEKQTSENLNIEVTRKYYQAEADNKSSNNADQLAHNQPLKQASQKQTNVNKQFLSSKAKTDNTQYSSLSLMYDLDSDGDGLWKPRPHNPMYLLPLYMHDKPNRSPSTPNQAAQEYSQNDYRSPELKFQLSFKSKVAQDLFDTDADLWLGYTQQSHWQVYNEDNSRPFRAHDYMPELFLTQPVKANLPFGGRLRMLGAGVMHHSNGEDDPLSRSWNKMYFMGGAEWDRLTIIPKLAIRLNTDTSSKPDDNPDIEDYYGYGDVKVLYDMDADRSLAGTFRLNPSTGKGAVELDYIYQMDNSVNLFVNLFHGYGESIIDYNHEDTAIGLGVMLNDWRGF